MCFNDHVLLFFWWDKHVIFWNYQLLVEWAWKKLKSYHVSQFKTLELWRWKAIKSYLMHIWIFGTNLTPLSPLFPMSQKKSQKTHKHLKIVEYFCETLATENWRNLNYNNKNETLIHSISKWCVYVCEIVFESDHFSFTWKVIFFSKI